MPSRADRIRAIVADDEPIARERLALLLRDEPDIDVVAQCGDGEDALHAIRRERPDLVLLDIDMPGASGMEIAATLTDRSAPAVVFVTAYDQYAVNAFEIRAVDYLLKPFSAVRFKQMIAHAREAVHRRRAEASVPAAGRRYPERIVIKSTGRIYFVRVEDIDWCQAAGNYIRLHVGRAEHLLRQTMIELQQMLDPAHFVRIHRSTIVNVNRVEELRPLFGGDYAVVLRGGVELTLSRRFRYAAARLLGNVSNAPAAPLDAPTGAG